MPKKTQSVVQNGQITPPCMGKTDKKAPRPGIPVSGAVYSMSLSTAQKRQQCLCLSVAKQIGRIALTEYPLGVLTSHHLRSIALQPSGQNLKRLAIHRQGMRHPLTNCVHYGALLVHERLTYSRFMTEQCGYVPHRPAQGRYKSYANVTVL
jgi:hypothetical protein